MKKRTKKKDKVVVHSPHMSIHHWLPKSRGGKQNQTVEIPSNFHICWHVLFGNLTPRECEDFLMTILICFRDFKRMDKETIDLLREACKRGQR